MNRQTGEMGSGDLTSIGLQHRDRVHDLHSDRPGLVNLHRGGGVLDLQPFQRRTSLLPTALLSNRPGDLSDRRSE